jgi:hypothetical protein
MAFIKKRRSGKERFSYQLVETYRKGGKVKQRILCNLGRYPSLALAIQGEIENLEFYRSWSWPPHNLVRQYGTRIPAAILEQARLERECRESDQEDRIHRLQEMYSKFCSVRKSQTLPHL